MTARMFQFGDRVVHAEKSEWGVGTVTAAAPATQDGKPCQRLTVRFERAGLKTLSTAYAHLQPAEDRVEIEHALAQAGTDFAPEHGAKQVQEIMTRLPEPATDPFASLENRLKATLALYRFEPTGSSLIDWAAGQSALKDPLSKFNRHQLEEYFRRFTVARDQHLRKLLGEAQRSDPAMIARALQDAPRQAKDAVRRSDWR